MSARVYTHDLSNVDPIALERAIAGNRGNITLTYAERVGAVRELARRKYSDQEIADMIGVTLRSVQRLRAKWAIPGLPFGSNQHTRPAIIRDRSIV